MKRNVIYTLLVVLVAAALTAVVLLQEEKHHHDMAHGEHAEEAEMPKGPNGGRLLTDGEFALEITLYERGIPPEFRVYAYEAGQPLSPDQVQLSINLSRLDGTVDQHRFKAEGAYLRGDSVVYEPHSFDVSINAQHKGKNYQWQYDNYEGRVQVSEEMAKASGLQVATTGPAVIRETVALTGRVHLDPKRVAHARARYPGMVKKVMGDLGDTIQRGDTLAVIQSDESLQNYKLTAPIKGVILARDIQTGEASGSESLFTIADLSKVWIELDVFAKDLTRIRQGQAVQIETLDGKKIDARIDWLSPMAAHASQSVQARVVVDNRNGLFRPGQFVRGSVTIEEHKVPLAVRRSAIQDFRDFKVVFERIGDTYEVRMLEMGRADDQWVEVLEGIKAGREYVTGNSYLIKADIEKSGASHDH